jgi:hypothetical protein
MKIIPFPVPQRPAQRREISAIPTWYRLRPRVQALAHVHSYHPHDFYLSEFWIGVAVIVFFALASTLVNAAPQSLAQISAPNPQTATSAPHNGSPGAAASPAFNPATGKTEEDIRDIRGPVHIKPSWLWAAWTAGTLALAGILYALYRWWKARARARAKTLYELALEALEKARSLMTPETARDYSFAVSEITRRYIEARFNVRAAHRTTEEFLHDLVANPTGGLADYSVLLEDFLKHCDLVKFARWTLSLGEMESMHASAVTFINGTRPQIPGATASSSQLQNSSQPPQPPQSSEVVSPVGPPPPLPSPIRSEQGVSSSAPAAAQSDAQRF